VLTKTTLALIVALVLASASTAFAQSYRQIGHPHRRAGFQPVPALTNARNFNQSTQNCNVTYRGFRLCDWLRPSPWP
jgi:hypothetical protein